MASKKSSSRKPEELKKMSLIQLKEILSREESLLKNKSIISKLSDKGESIKKFHEQVKYEIKYREEMADLEISISTLQISESDKHVQKLCELEKSPGKERYKPFSTLNTTKEIHTDRKVFKTMEDWSKCNKPTKLIPLAESMEILKQQDEKIKEEQIKFKHRLLERQLEEEHAHEEEDEDSESEVDKVESESEDEETVADLHILNT
ncbi:unnamed protein product [Diabrotica balteata]|uniref:Uncharacterized protein n=1 Tax=Diabrotica balteata TaxID=107213 RepID=A0A9N9T716_DIABA|nr:unnamed protein product [Diabrotica balteata]